jgi:hypothetical protein
MSTTLTILSCHSDSDIKINAILYNLKFLLEISSTIVIVNSDEFKGILEQRLPIMYNQKSIIINDVLSDELCYLYKTTYADLQHLSIIQLKNHWIEFGKKEKRNFPIPTYTIYFEYTKNDKFIAHGKWLYSLNKYNYTAYKNIILTNDSILITRSLYDFNKLMTPDTEMVALLDSYQTKHHYPDFLRAYNSVGIKKIINYYQENKQKITDFFSVITIYEIESSYIFNSVNILFKSADTTPVNIHFSNTILFDYLYNKQYPIVKIKKILNTEYETFPLDFNKKEYKMLNADLKHLNEDNDELKIHFQEHGMKEGRPYKKNQLQNKLMFLDIYLKLVGFIQ